jgi:hypothetical protein
MPQSNERLVALALHALTKSRKHEERMVMPLWQTSLRNALALELARDRKLALIPSPRHTQL